jgi:DNA repair protein RadC
MKTTNLYSLKKLHSDFPQKKITSSKEAADFIRQFYSDDIEIYESFFILLLNRANKTIGYAKISQGGITGTVVDVKIIAKYIVESLAAKIIIVHNHPSGQLFPSETDKIITNNIKDVCKLLDTSLVDHCILTPDSYYSFADNGLI